MKTAYTKITILSALLAALFAVSAGAIDWGKLKTAPVDPEDAQNVRVWLGIDRPNKCRTTVTVVDSDRDTVRHLFSTLMGQGYFNFYWDKLDDSGLFVDTGQYRYIVDDCQGIRVGGKLRVDYKPYEQFVSLETDSVRQGKYFSVWIGRDSIPVSLTINNRVGKTVDTVLVDSVLMAGEHRIDWQPADRFSPGIYKARLQAGEFVILSEFRYSR